MKAPTKNGKSREEPPLYIGHQWGDPLDIDGRLSVKRVGRDLKITAALPHYLEDNHPCDFMHQYSNARKNRSIGKQRTGKDSPHIRFANVQSDEELINFVSTFGPVVCKASSMLSSMTPERSGKGAGEPIGALLEARQDLRELRDEQKIYRAALNLISELTKRDADYDSEHAQKQIIEIAQGIQDWPRQWCREKMKRGKDPLWRVRKESIQRIAALAKSGQSLLLPPQVDARIVICEILNVFPSLAFPNPLEMHSYLRFGIRPLLYSVLRREFLQTRDVGVCANTQCREFFEIERAGQRFCDEICSRHQRQREYWQTRGNALRTKRMAGNTTDNT